MIIPDDIAALALNEQYFDLRGLSVYSSMGISTLRYHIRENDLPAFKIPGKKDRTGKVLVKRSEFDGWIERFRENDFVDIRYQTNRSRAWKKFSRQIMAGITTTG